MVASWTGVPGVSEAEVARAERVIAEVCAAAGVEVAISSAPYDDPEEDDRVLLVTCLLRGGPIELDAFENLEDAVAHELVRERLTFPHAPIAFLLRAA